MITKKTSSKIKNFISTKFPLLTIFLMSTRSTLKQQISKIYIKRLLKVQNELSIEVGGGDKKGKNGWITIDVTDNCDIFWDLRNGIPFPQNSVAKIYSSHFFEHLTFAEGQIFLKDCLRVLAPGGYFSICVPNAKLYIRAYLNHNLLDENYFGFKPAYNHTTKIDYVNYTAYMNGEHKYMFDKENLIYLLKSVGFKAVKSRKFDPNLDMKIRNYESIYAEAIK